MKLNAEVWYYIAVIVRFLCVAWDSYRSVKRDGYMR